MTPATIAILRGKIKIGLTPDELEELALDKLAIKASRRDIPYALSQRLNAGTTVAATAFCADCAGIRVFATGGIGGVHRGDVGDISADLLELARTPIAVVCAGIKSILDLPKTLEFLEMHSIPVIGYQTDTLPAFYTAESLYPLSMRVNHLEALAQLLQAHWSLGMTSGIVIANPIPLAYEIPASIIEPAIQQALKLAETNQIHGKAITPFLLQSLTTITQGKSLSANIHLLKNNVQLGAQLASQLHSPTLKTSDDKIT